MIVRLTDEEMEFAAITGSLRRARALIRGQSDRYGRVDTEPWRHDIEGVAGEMAVAKLLNRYWCPTTRVQRNGVADVGAWQVRCTSHPNGCLLVKDGDADDAYFILVRGTAPTLDVVGWLRGGDGKRAEWRRNVRGREAFFVPASALQPFANGA